VRNRFRTVVVAAGNEGGGTGEVLSPAMAYSVISVGNFDDRNTVAWTDDVMNSSSSYVDPISTHGDREKPELAAPGTNINATTPTSPWIGGIGTGTSFSAPMVTGVVGLMLQRQNWLRDWPETVKAVLMVTAIHNIEGASALSEKDGAGGIAADRADDL